MSWSRREMSAESVASTNEPSSMGDGDGPFLLHRKPEMTTSNNIDHQSASLPAYLAQNLVAALTGNGSAPVGTALGRVGAQQEHATTISPAPEQQLATTIQEQHFPPSALSAISLAAHKLSDSMSSPLVSNELQQQQQQQQQQTFSDWWDEYWSRQPFPSGYTQSSITLLACFISTIIFLIVVGNLLVCIAIFTEKSLKPTQNWFIASLAVSDMLLGLVVMPFSLARELMGFWVFGPLWCDIHEAVDVLLTTASINTLCLISLDRYWSITQAVSYLKKRTPRRGAFMIAFVWVFSAAVSLPPLFGWKKQQIPIVLVSKQPAPAANQTSQLPAASSDARSRSSSRLWPDTASGLDYDTDSAPVGTEQPEEAQRDPPASRRSRRRPLDASELARPAPVGRRETFQPQETDLAGPELAPIQASTRAPATTAPTMQPPSGADSQATVLSDYPTCQLSDDLGYVLYSALGSFYIPCAVMVFTYIKIFLAARSRARRAISKQGRGAGGPNKRAATAAAAAAAASRRSNAGCLAAPSKQQLGCNTSTISGQVISYAGSISHNESSNNDHQNQHQHQHTARLPEGPAETNMPTPMMQGGKIVIVERKKSLAANLASVSASQQTNGSESGPLAAIQAAANLTGASKLASSHSVETEPGAAAEASEQKEAGRCTLTTSGAKQASASALNSSASNDSSMITVMHSSMAELPPVTRFNFRDPSELPDARATPLRRQTNGAATADHDEGTRKAAALLEAIRQVGAHEQHLVSEVLDETGGGDKGSETKEASEVPDIVVEQRPAGSLPSAIQLAEPDQELERENEATAEANCCDGLNATSETCFMTIEEDSDMFESQTGRTITMVAAGASQRQTSSLARNQSTIVTMMPASQHSTTVCSDAACRSAHRPAGTTSASSYCGSSMTINDDDDDEDDEDDVVDCDEDDDDDDDDDEPLTDECNGYSCSAYDHYCPDQDLSSTCGQCQECEQDELKAALRAGPNAPKAETGLSPTRKQLQQQARHHHRHHNQQQPQPQPRGLGQNRRQQQHEADTTEVQSITGDDNLSLTEYRSNEDDENSSIIGHDVLDATDSRRRDRDPFDSKKKQSISGPSTNERKKSSIGFRLARLGSTAPLSNYSGGLIALASSTQQQQQQQQQQSGGTRNLKALRQNFFLKLNQLTAKSATKQQQESKSKKGGSTSPLGGKSSAQSSGTSYEPSVDYATTSNMHSNEYPQETTIEADESEQHSSSEQAQIIKQQSSDGHNNNNNSNKAKDLTNDGPDGEEMCAKGFPTSERQTDGAKFARHGDKTILLKNSSNNSNNNNNNNGNNGNDPTGAAEGGADLEGGGTRHNNINQMVGRISSGLVSTSKSAAAVGVGGAGLGKSQRFDLDNNHHPRHHHEPSAAMGGTAGGGGGGGKKRPTIGGYSSTMISSSAGSGQPTSQRAYLASDNERHKRKLAKARERRATLILGLIMATFICSWLPFFTFYVLRAICSSCKDNVSPRFEAFIFWMGYCNSAINPIIYTIFNRDFRKAFRKILFKCL